MNLEEYLMSELHIKAKSANKIIKVLDNYKKEYGKKKLNIRIPNYTLGEEIFNSISHGIGAGLAIIYFILLLLKASSFSKGLLITFFGISMILLYVISCIYHALSSKLEGKKVLRVIDHCNVFLLVFGTYVPMALLGIGGVLGWAILGIVFIFTVLGIVFTAIHIDKYQVISVICHLISGWISLIALPKLLLHLGGLGLFFLILGGIMYTVGSILYGLGSKKKYMHSVFHIFCLLGTFFHFLTIYMFLM